MTCAVYEVRTEIAWTIEFAAAAVMRAAAGNSVKKKLESASPFNCTVVGPVVVI